MGSTVLTNTLVPCTGFGYPESQWDTQYMEEQLRPGIPHQSTTSQIHVSIQIKVLYWRRIVWLGNYQANTVLQADDALYFM